MPKQATHTAVERKHARLSPSGAHRWMKCPAAPRLEAQYPNTSSPFAMEGTAAHEVVEWCLKNTKGAEDFPHEYVHVPDHTGKLHDFFVSTDMREHVDVFVKRIWEIKGDDGELHSEIKIDFTRWVVDGFGYSDVAIVHEAQKHLTVADFKYGKGVAVDAVDNMQGAIYALGVYDAYSMLHDLDTITIAIGQPRLGSYSEWELGRDELLAIGDTVSKAAKAAFKHDAVPSPGADQCKFCKAKGDCAALTDLSLRIAMDGFMPVNSRG